MSGYLFNRDYKASNRLNLNHWVFKGLMGGWLLHSKIKHSEDAAIADIGAGTGIWLQELAELTPSPAKLVGFDISTDQYPPVAWRMSNVTLLEQDCFQPFPEEHHGKYDVVALRFFRCIVRNGDPGPLLKNVLTLLKPGGYIQWIDVLGSEAHVEGKTNDIPTPMSDQLAKMSLLPAADLDAEWVGKLPELFANSGLEVLVEQRYPFRDSYRQAWGLSMLAGIDETSAKRGEDAAKQAQGFISGLSAEMEHGALVEHPLICVVGRKTAQRVR